MENFDEFYQFLLRNQETLTIHCNDFMWNGQQYIHLDDYLDALLDADEIDADTADDCAMRHVIWSVVWYPDDMNGCYVYYSSTLANIVKKLLVNIREVEARRCA